MLWSGSRHGDTMADLIFCLAFLRLQVSLEERPAQHGIASTMASAGKGIFGGQHDEDLGSLFNPTFMDDLAVLVEGNTERSARRTPSHVSVGKTEAIVLIRGDKAKEMKRRLYAEVEEGAAKLETPAGPLRLVGNHRHLGCRVDCIRTQSAELALGAFTSWRPGNPDEGQDECGEVDRSRQASPLGWPVDELEQSPAGTSACEAHGASATYPWPAQAARARDPQDARLRGAADAQGSADGSPAGCRQVAVGNPDGDLTAGLGPGGLLPWCGVEGGVDSMELVGEVTKDKHLASRPTRGKSSGTSDLVSGLHC